MEQEGAKRAGSKSYGQSCAKDLNLTRTNEAGHLQGCKSLQNSSLSWDSFDPMIHVIESVASVGISSSFTSSTMATTHSHGAVSAPEVQPQLLLSRGCSMPAVPRCHLRCLLSPK